MAVVNDIGVSVIVDNNNVMGLRPGNQFFVKAVRRKLADRV